MMLKIKIDAVKNFYEIGIKQRPWWYEYGENQESNWREQTLLWTDIADVKR